MKVTLRLMGIAGLLVFGAALALSYVSPIHIERAARGFIQSRIESQIRGQLASVAGEARTARAGRAAAVLLGRHQQEIDALRGIVADLETQVAATIGRMQDPGCECRQLMLQRTEDGVERRLAVLNGAEPQLRRIIEGNYGDIVARLLRDLRIFTGTNALAFLLMLGLSVAKPAHARQLLVPGILLGVAVLAASAFYAFGQNWFFALLTGDFAGPAYALWLLLIFGLLCDVALFKARITTMVVDASVTAATKAAIPC